MRRGTVLVAAIAAAAIGSMATTGPVTTAGADLATDQADSVEFALHFPREGGGEPEEPFGDVVYCGVGHGSEAYVLDVVVSRPHGVNETFTGVGPAGWLEVQFQGVGLFPGPFEFPEGSGEFTRRPELIVPYNSSLAFTLSLGGRPGHDQLVRLMGPPLGDTDGGGGPMHGYASVRAAADAVDPFRGDGRSDNFCVTIGDPTLMIGGERWSEFVEGDIRTSMPVPDSWVIDGNGADGGVLVGMPH
jgi:hypothetical protein